MKWFTSDWHLGDNRLGGKNNNQNLFFRPTDDDSEMSAIIINNFKNTFQDGDELYHLGNVLYNPEVFDFPELAKSFKDLFPNSKFNLILGDHDNDKIHILSELFTNILADIEMELSDGTQCYLNHYPVCCLEYMNELREFNMDYSPRFLITGNVHSLWKVQRSMLNVGVDAWHFKPVSEMEVIYCKTSINKYYDKNVFPYN